jgi:hypothetical protein
VSRPSTFTPEIGDIICGKIVEGLSLRTICLDEALPEPATVYRWLRTNDVFREQYTRAREDQAEGYADDIVGISDEREYEKIEVEGVLVGVKFDATAVQRNKLRVEARKWTAAKLLPKKYGDRTQVEHSGKVGLESIIAGEDPAKP